MTSGMITVTGSGNPFTGMAKKLAKASWNRLRVFFFFFFFESCLLSIGARRPIVDISKYRPQIQTMYTANAMKASSSEEHLEEPPDMPVRPSTVLDDS